MEIAARDSDGNHAPSQSRLFTPNFIFITSSQRDFTDKMYGSDPLILFSNKIQRGFSSSLLDFGLDYVCLVMGDIVLWIL